MIECLEVEAVFSIEAPEMKTLYNQCLAFLDALEIQAARNVGYLCKAKQKDSDYLIALIPYQIEGLCTEYKNQLVNRDRMPSSGKGPHIMDAPWAAFAFDGEMQMVKAEVSTFETENAQPLTGQAISWKQAAESVLETVVATRVQCKQTLEGEPEYNESRFWNENRVQLVRALPMWMPNWHNVCRPGWCIQYQLYDRATDAFLCSMSYCADALTGEVAR